MLNISPFLAFHKTFNLVFVILMTRKRELGRDNFNKKLFTSDVVVVDEEKGKFFVLFVLVVLYFLFPCFIFFVYFFMSFVVLFFIFCSLFY